MSERKFRGIRDGVWYYGFYFSGTTSELDQRPPLFVGDCQIRHMILYKEEDILKSVEVEKGSIGQDTGLKDKNGKEIYEGDILHGLYGFSIETAVVVRNYCKWSILHGDAYYDPIHRDIGEVVGNIHENPELLLEDQ